MLIGVVADDLTGATDVALMLQRAGMSVVQAIGVPASAAALPDADAVVVSLKSRTCPAKDAVEQSLASARALRARGAKQILFKYCSTFDSTDAGNIGPVSDALMDELGAASAVFCPAFPANARTIYQGHLFVGGRLLSESSMRDHPLTPMRDPNLVRVLGRQTKRGVGLVPLPVIEAGPEAIGAAIAKEAAEERPFVVADAIADRHLLALGKALAGAPLVTGGSGIAMGLPGNFGFAPRQGRIAPMAGVPKGRRLVLSGSCSEATRRQVAHAIDMDMPALKLEPERLADGSQDASGAVRWLAEQSADDAVLIYATAEPAAVRKAQAALGMSRAGALVEEAMAEIAAVAVKRGATRLIVAGGETSGAVVQALGARALAIGPEIDPGAPWTRVVDGPAVALALKSGNFGKDDFFTRAWSLIA
jgi:3-dehydrotetronate 4-kinase